MFSGLRRAFKLLLIAAVTALVVAFAVSNRTMISIRLFPLEYEAQLPIFLFALLCIMLGALIAGLTMSGTIFKEKRLRASEHRHVVALKNELKGVQAQQSGIMLAKIEPKA